MSNITIGIILLIAHFSSSIIIGIVYSRIHYNNIIHEKSNFSNSYAKNSYKRGEKETIFLPNMTKFEILQKSMLNTFVTLGYILGFMVIFNLLADITYACLNNINLIKNVYALNVISGMFEVTRGIKSISNYAEYFNNILVMSFLLGFSGLSVIFQIKSCFKNLNISITKLVTFKFLHGILAVIVAYILLKYTNILDISNLSVFSSIEAKEYYHNQITSAYINSISLIIFILSTYLLIKNESRYKNKK